MATTSKINLGDGSTVEMTRKEGVPDAIWNDVVKFVKENVSSQSVKPTKPVYETKDGVMVADIAALTKLRALKQKEKDLGMFPKL